MKTALFLALLAGTVLSTSGEGSLGATRAKIHTLREQVNLLGEILEHTERVADMAARQPVQEGNNKDDDGAEPLEEMLERFFYGLMRIVESMVKGEHFQTKISSLSELLASLPKNYSKVTHKSEQQGNATINTTTTVEKSQGDGGSYSFGHVQTVVDGPDQQSFSSVVQESFQSSSGSIDGDNTANNNTASAKPPTDASDKPPSATPTPKAEATPTPKAADDDTKEVRNLKLLEILQLLREAKAEEDN